MMIPWAERTDSTLKSAALLFLLRFCFALAGCHCTLLVTHHRRHVHRWP